MRDAIRGRPPCLAPSSIFASGPARSPFWLGLTRRHRKKNMRDPKYITTDRNQIRPRVNDTGNGLLRQRKWKYNKCFSSIIINSLLVNDGLNSTVHTFIFVVIIYYHILYIIIIFRNLLIITKPYEWRYNLLFKVRNIYMLRRLIIPSCWNPVRCWGQSVIEGAEVWERYLQETKQSSIPEDRGYFENRSAFR